MLKQAVGPLCRLHLPHQTKARCVLPGWLPIVSGLVWSAIAASLKMIYNYQNQFVWSQGIGWNMFLYHIHPQMWFTHSCTFLTAESVKRGDLSPNLWYPWHWICAVAVELKEFRSVPAPRGGRREGATTTATFPRKPRYFYKPPNESCAVQDRVTERLVKVQRHHSAFKFDQGTEMKSESGKRRVSACGSHTVGREMEDFKTRAIWRRDGKRDESRELRGSTFSLAFVLAFAVVSRW